MNPALHPGRQVGAVGPAEDDGGFEAFVRARLQHLLRFGYVLTGSEHAAADLVQDALERSLLRWSRITSDDPEGYVRRTMVNRSISVWRKLGRERVTDEVPVGTYRDPERDEALLAALRRLPARQRAVIALRYYEDLTEARTAQVLGCSIGTVKSQSSLAMTRLRTLLETTQEES
ncbi:MAG: SigE family RNA polymerase sigma factor [Marmoricola sp.]